MTVARVPAFSISPSSQCRPSLAVPFATCRRRQCSLPTAFRSPFLGIGNDDNRHRFPHYRESKYWDNFYKRHQNKFFKDRHYLEKDWGQYFSDDNTTFPNGKVVLESHVDFSEDRVNAFVCDVANDDICDRIMPSSIDVVTLIFTLSAVCPKMMPLVLHNIKKVLKPNGYVLLRDYASGDYAQLKLQNRNQMISENFYARGDGTRSFYFSEDSLSTLFTRAGFDIVQMNIYCRQIENRSRNITMSRRWIRAIFSQL